MHLQGFIHQSNEHDNSWRARGVVSTVHTINTAGWHVEQCSVPTRDSTFRCILDKQGNSCCIQHGAPQGWILEELKGGILNAKPITSQPWLFYLSLKVSVKSRRFIVVVTAVYNSNLPSPQPLIVITNWKQKVQGLVISQDIFLFKCHSLIHSWSDGDTGPFGLKTHTA